MLCRNTPSKKSWNVQKFTMVSEKEEIRQDSSPPKKESMLCRNNASKSWNVQKFTTVYEIEKIRQEFCAAFSESNSAKRWKEQFQAVNSPQAKRPLKCLTSAKMKSCLASAKMKSCLSSPKLKSCLGSPKMNKQKAKKQVRFHSSTKKWDGPRQEHVFLERLAIEFWQQTPSIAVLNELVNDENDVMLQKVRDLLLAAMERVDQTEHINGAELIPGGGKHGIRLNVCNLPHAKLLLKSISEAYDTVILSALLSP